jgi:hypothetical protein
MSANRRQTRSQGPLPPEDNPNNNDSDSGEQEPPKARRETPQQQRRAREDQRRRPQERDPEDFNFMPQHANPGGNQEPDVIMRMWTQISLIHLRINKIQISSNLNNRSSNQIIFRDSRMYQDQANSSKYLLHKVHLFQILLKKH